MIQEFERATPGAWLGRLAFTKGRDFLLLGTNARQQNGVRVGRFGFERVVGDSSYISLSAEGKLTAFYNVKADTTAVKVEGYPLSGTASTNRFTSTFLICTTDKAPVANPVIFLTLDYDDSTKPKAVTLQPSASGNALT